MKFENVRLPGYTKLTTIYGIAKTVFYVSPFVILATLIWSLSLDPTVRMPSWLAIMFIMEFAIAPICFGVAETAEKYIDKYYNLVQRGIVMGYRISISAQTEILVDGYTYANVRKQQWRCVGPSVWRTIRAGDIHDFTR